MKRELKEFIKPPLHLLEGIIYGVDNLPLYEIKSFTRDLTSYTDTCGVELRNYLFKALNEKAERDFAEPLRWIKSRSLGIDWIDCPKCKHGLQEGTKDLNFCPHCGQKLDPPERVNN